MRYRHSTDGPGWQERAIGGSGELQTVERRELRNWVIAVYGLYLLAAISAGVVAILGVFVAYAKRGAARGTIWESHVDNQIRTFWISLLLFLVAFPLALIFVGWIVWGVMLAYYLWKSVKGLVRAVDSEPYY
jgi:uncharacterized membrane protein